MLVTHITVFVLLSAAWLILPSTVEAAILNNGIQVNEKTLNEKIKSGRIFPKKLNYMLAQNNIDIKEKPMFILEKRFHQDALEKYLPVSRRRMQLFTKTDDSSIGYNTGDREEAFDKYHKRDRGNVSGMNKDKNDKPKFCRYVCNAYFHMCLSQPGSDLAIFNKCLMKRKNCKNTC